MQGKTGSQGNGKGTAFKVGQVEEKEPMFHTAVNPDSPPWSFPAHSSGYSMPLGKQRGGKVGAVVAGDTQDRCPDSGGQTP